MTTKAKPSYKLLLALVIVAIGSGLMVRGQSPQAVGTWAASGAIANGRAGAASAALDDGRTLISGGAIAGTATASVIVYNPADNSSASAGQLTSARVGHTATLLEDGRVLIAGGAIGGVVRADLEVFNPADGTSVPVGTMSSARAGHGAARLADGTVLLVGGSDGTAALASAEVFDANTGESTAVGSMAAARSGVSATRLIDNRVLVAGGYNGSTDLTSAEIFNPFTQTFDSVPTTLGAARSGHSAILLPHNNGVLIAGGTSAGVPLVNADLFLPAQFPDPYSYGMGQFAATGAMTVARANAASGPAAEGFAFVQGGGSDDGERYRFATIKTDKDDYSPGEPAVITGSGWHPNETVTLLFQEDPAVHDDYVLQVQADGDGTLYWDQWAPEQHDFGVRFYLLAQGSQSRAQTTFTDGNRVSFSTAPLGDIVTNFGSLTANECFNAYVQERQGANLDTDHDARVVNLSSTPGDATFYEGHNCSGSPDPSVTIEEDATFAAFSFKIATPTALQYTITGDAVDVNTNNDASATVSIETSYSINDVSASETNGVTVFTFTVTKSVSGTASTVQYATADDTATGGAACGPGVDYVSVPATTLNFGASDTTRTFDVTVCGDASFENDETFFVNLSGATGAAVTDDQGVGTINNDDAAPTLSIDNVTLDEGNTLTTDFTFTVTKDGSTEVTATVDFATDAGLTHPATAGTACDPGVDYQTQTGPLSFGPSETTKTIVIKVCGEAVYERDQTFVVNLTNPAGATLTGGGQRLGTITNDDTAPTLSMGDVLAAEGNGPTPTDFTFTVTASGPTEVDATADFATSVGGANPATTGATCGAGVDYESQSGNVTVSASTGTGTITVKVCGDSVYELNQTFVVTLTNPVDATFGDDNAVGTIDNDDNAPSLSIGDVSLNEGNSLTTNFVFTVTKGGDTEVDATVSFATADGATNPATGGAACPSADYLTQTGGSLTVGATETTKQITVQVCGEMVFELDQDFLVNLSSPTNATLLDGQGVGTILNDDAAPTLNIDNVTLNEGNGPATTNFTFTVSKVGTTEVNANVDFATADGGSEPASGGSCPGSDYQSKNGSLTFAPGDTSKSITVYVCGDAVFEANQTFLVNLGNPGSASIGEGEGLGTINNDDAAPSLSITSVTQAEGDSGTTNFSFTVTKTGDTELNATVDFATADGVTNPGTAGALCGPGVDYETLVGSLTFAPLVTTQQITVKVCGDIAIEPTETFRVVLSNPANASIGTGTGTGTINNDDLYTFTGFFAPVENPPVLNGVNAGRAIPLKWELRDPAGNLVLDLGTVDRISYTPIACGAETVDEMESYADDSGFSELRLTATGYHFNWKTEKNFGNKCYEIRFTLDDGSVHAAKFKFKK